MRLVFQDKKKPGRIVVAWTWLPFFIGDNKYLVEKIKEDMTSTFKEQEITEELLDKMHDVLLNSIVERFPIKGLREYLAAVKGVESGEVA